jgi:hypothetical protein
MDYPCHRCGAQVEEGTPFCPHCGAPQIRVPGSEPASPSLPPGTPDEIQPPAQPVDLQGGRTQATAGVDWPQAVRASAIVGVVLALAFALPFAGVLLGTLAAGSFTVALYRRRVPETPLTPGLGARIGAIAGLFGFALFAVLLSLSMLANRGSGLFRQMLQQGIEQAAARTSDPQAQEALQRLMSPAGLAVLVTFALIMFLVVFLALSSLGGALGARLFGKKGPQ